MTVVQRGQIGYSGISGGTFAVGNTVTGSVSGATGTVTAVTANFLYVIMLLDQDSKIQVGKL